MSTAAAETREQVLDAVGAAAFLGMSVDWVYRQSAVGLLPCRKIGRKTKFLVSELESWIRKQPSSATPVVPETP